MQYNGRSRFLERYDREITGRKTRFCLKIFPTNSVWIFDRSRINELSALITRREYIGSLPKDWPKVLSLLLIFYHTLYFTLFLDFLYCFYLFLWIYFMNYFYGLFLWTQRREYCRKDYIYNMSYTLFLHTARRKGERENLALLRIRRQNKHQLSLLIKWCTPRKISEFLIKMDAFSIHIIFSSTWLKRFLFYC